MNNNPKTKQKSIGALWEHQSNAGKFFLSGKVEIETLRGTKVTEIVVFPNSFKDPHDASQAKQPDFLIYESRPKENSGTAGSGGSSGSVGETSKPQPRPTRHPVSDSKGSNGSNGTAGSAGDDDDLL